MNKTELSRKLGRRARRGKSGDDDAIIGQRINTIRVKRGWSLVEAAAAIDVSWQQFRKYETGENRISASALKKLAAHLAVKPGAFFDKSRLF